VSIEKPSAFVSSLTVKPKLARVLIREHGISCPPALPRDENWIYNQVALRAYYTPEYNSPIQVKDVSKNQLT
jgi:hypothetical protein